METYPLPATHLGIAHAARLTHIVPSVALAVGPGTYGVTIEPDNLAHGWNVRSEHGLLGWLDASQSADYPALERLRLAEMSAATMASIELTEASLLITVRLGLAPWQLPLNAPPPGSAVLAGGIGVAVNSAASADIMPEQLLGLGTAQLFVLLESVGDTVVASLENHVLGTLTVPDYVRELVISRQNSNKVCARAYCTQGRIGVDIPKDPSASFEAPAPALPDAAAHILPPPPPTKHEYYFAAETITTPVPHDTGGS